MRQLVYGKSVVDATTHRRGVNDTRQVSILCNLLKNISWHILSRRETPYVIYLSMYIYAYIHIYIYIYIHIAGCPDHVFRRVVSASD